MKNNLYKNGLEIGDLVKFNFYLFGKKYNKLSRQLYSLVLEKNLMFTQETKWGIKSFFEYKMLNVYGDYCKKIVIAKTQQIEIIEVNKSN